MEKRVLQLLNKQNVNLLSIIEVLTSESVFYSIKDISETLNLSIRSTQRYIKLIEEQLILFKEQSKSSIQIEIQKNIGVKLSSHSSTEIDQYTEFLLTNDKNLLFLEKILLDQTETVQEIPSKVSIDKIASFLEEFNLRLNKNNFKLAGNEATIRAITCGFMRFMYRSTDWPESFSSLNYTQIQKNVDQLTASFSSHINAFQQKDLMFLIAINLIRYQADHKINLDYIKHYDLILMNDPEWGISKSCESIYQSYQIYSPDEIKFLTLNISLKPFIYDNPLIRKQIFHSHTSEHSELIQISNIFIEEFNYHIHSIKPDQYDTIFAYTFRSHVFALLYKGIDFDYNTYSFLREDSDRFHQYEHQLRRFIRYLFEKTNHIVFKQEEFLLRVYYVVCNYVNPNFFLEPSIKIEIHSELPDIYQNCLIHDLSNQFNQHYNLQFISTYSMQEADVILATTSLDRPSSAQVVMIDFPLTNRSYESIDYALSHIVKKKIALQSTVRDFYFENTALNDSQ